MGKRLLLVDDLQFMRTVLREILEGSGLTICGEAVNGKEAVEQYQALKPDGGILDITMPVMNGIDALGRIRKIDRDATIIMCSAMGQESMILKAIQFGAKDFVVKPFSRNRIVSAVKKALKVPEDA